MTKGSCAVALLLDESSLVARVIRPFFEKIFLDHYRRDLSSSGPIDLVLLRRLARGTLYVLRDEWLQRGKTQ